MTPNSSKSRKSSSSSSSIALGSMVERKWSCLTSLTGGLLLLLVAIELAAADSDGANSSPGASETGGLEFEPAPKREYLISPRIGRSPSQPVWGSLEGQLVAAPNRWTSGQVLGSSPRSSLLFFLNSQTKHPTRLIGPLGGGLLPSPRFGRRSSPMGLLPQPRVGRSLGATSGAGEQEQTLAGGEQEAVLSNSLGEALESYLDG